MAEPQLDRFTAFHGRLSDLTAVWFPLLFLKPSAPSVHITWRRMLVMTPCFAGWFTLVLTLKTLLFGDADSLSTIGTAKVFGWAFLAFFCWFNIVTCPLWNRRARFLRENPEPQSSP